MEFARELSTYLTRIQELCREYPTQPDGPRKMTFASIRIAADSIAAVSEDQLPSAGAADVREHTNAIQASVDDLADRFGSDNPARCRACAKTLRRVSLGGGNELAYCEHCPREILEAVRAISDLTGAEVL